MFVYCHLLKARVVGLFAERCWPDNLWKQIIRLETFRQSTQYLMVASPWLNFLIWKEVFLQPLGVRQRNGGEIFLDPLQWWDRRWEKTYVNINAAELRWMQVSIIMLVCCGEPMPIFSCCDVGLHLKGDSDF
jgi:hypothetical protein